MNPRDLAFIDWQKGMKPKQLSEKYGISTNTVKSWILRNWKTKAGAPERVKEVHPPREQGALNNKAPSSAAVSLQLADAEVENENLTDKQRFFCLYYIYSYNATQSAIKTGYSRDTAGQIGYQLLQKTSIQKEVARLRGTVHEATNADLPDIVWKLSSIAFDDIGNHLDFRTERTQTGTDEDGSPLFDYKTIVEFRDSHTIDTRNISEISISDKGQLKLKLYSRDAALYRLAEIALKLRSLDIALLKMEREANMNDETQTATSNFIEALQATAAEAWNGMMSGNNPSPMTDSSARRLSRKSLTAFRSADESSENNWAKIKLSTSIFTISILSHVFYDFEGFVEYFIYCHAQIT